MARLERFELANQMALWLGFSVQRSIVTTNITTFSKGD